MYLISIIIALQLFLLSSGICPIRYASPSARYEKNSSNVQSCSNIVIVIFVLQIIHFGVNQNLGFPLRKSVKPKTSRLPNVISGTPGMEPYLFDRLSRVHSVLSVCFTCEVVSGRLTTIIWFVYCNRHGDSSSQQWFRRVL